MSIQTSSVVAFVVTVAIGTAALGLVRVAVVPPAAGAGDEKRTKDGKDAGQAQESAEAEVEVEAAAEAGTDVPPGRSLAEMMAEHDRLLQALRDAEASGDGAALMKLVEESEGKFRAPATIVEHSAYRAIAFCKTGNMEDGEREASLWLQTHEKHSLRAKVEAACRGNESDTGGG